MDISRIFTGIFMLVICLAFAAAGVWMQFYRNTDYIETQAEIVDIQTTVNRSSSSRRSRRHAVPIVRYEVDGQTYEGPSDVWDSTMRVGQTITILYNPANPAQIAGDPGWLGWFFIGIGGLSAIFSVVFMFTGGSKRV